MKKLKLIVLLLLLLLSAGVNLQAQKVTKNFRPENLKSVLKEVEKQTGFSIIYRTDEVNERKQINASFVNASVESVLNRVLDSNLSYSIENKMIVIHQKGKETPSKENAAPQTNTKSVSGVITDATQEPLIGVTVKVRGTNDGATTDIDGQFNIANIPDDAVLEVTYVGMHPQTISVAGKSTFDIVMTDADEQLKEVVVTALGIKRDKKMLGYAIQDIKSDALNKTGDPSITGALQGKVAGLQMNTSSTGLNGSTKITLRGNSSLTDNNQPLWVVDGVPFNDNNDSGASLYGGVDRGGASVDINPEDIESISVLKGPNAAALYGSRAGNGVIIITTKKGTKSQGFGVTYNGSMTWTNVASTLHMQDLYGQGTDGTFNPDSWFSFGSKLDGHEYTGWNGQSMKYQKYGDKLKDYFNTGFSQNHNVSIGNVTETSNYRMSVGNTNSNGIFNKEKLNKTTLDLKSGMDMNKYLSLDSKISLSNTRADNRPVFGKGGEVYQLLFMPNNINLDDLKIFRNEDSRHLNYVGPFPTVLNPYYVNYSNTNVDERWRSFGYFGMKLNFTSWLYATAKYAFDYYHTNIEEINRTNGIDDQASESYVTREDNFFEQNMEAMLFGNNEIGEKIRIDYSIGVNEMFQKTHFLLGKSSQMNTPEYWNHNSAQGLNAAEQALTRRKTRSAFGTFQFAWDEYLSLDLTARNDWSSTLPINNASYFYPSANLSFVVTDFMRKQSIGMPSWLTFAKVRLSAAQVGKDTDPFQLVTTGVWRQTFSGPQYSLPDAKANPNLKPELSSSYEAGLDMKFFDNRLGFDFTVYQSLTRNQIMTVPIAASSGFTMEWINAGEIENKGFEMMLYATPIQTNDFAFNLNVNLAHNVSTVKKLHDTSKYMSFNFRKDNLLVDVGAVEGGKLGDIFSNRGYLRDENGNILTRNGLPLFVNGRSKDPIGNIQPNLLMSVAPSLSYKGIALSALFDMRFGGNVVSMSEAVASGFGTAKRTENRENGVIINGIDETTGQSNNIEITAEEYYKAIGGENGLAEEFVYDASFIRLKELALSYNLPKSLLKATPINNIRLSLVGRNLAYLFSHTPGTSPEGGFDTTMFSQAIDFTSVPYTRTLGFSLNVSF